MPGVVANLLSIVLDILLNILLIHGTVGFGGSWHGLGYIGSPIGETGLSSVLFVSSYVGLHARFVCYAAATSVTSWLCLGVFCVHSFVIKKYHRRTWPGWNWNVSSRASMYPLCSTLWLAHACLCRFVCYCSSSRGAETVSSCLSKLCLRPSPQAWRSFKFKRFRLWLQSLARQKCQLTIPCCPC